jgi:hypothetical protein
MEPIYSNPLPKLPSNIIRAEIEVYVSGHSNDEFWYFNTPNEYAESLGTYGGGAYKECQVYINDKLVWIDPVFPTIYTGGLNPLLWRPVVAIGIPFQFNFQAHLK